MDTILHFCSNNRIRILRTFHLDFYSTVRKSIIFELETRRLVNLNTIRTELGSWGCFECNLRMVLEAMLIPETLLGARTIGAATARKTNSEDHPVLVLSCEDLPTLSLFTFWLVLGEQRCTRWPHVAISIAPLASLRFEVSPVEEDNRMLSGGMVG